MRKKATCTTSYESNNLSVLTVLSVYSGVESV